MIILEPVILSFISVIPIVIGLVIWASYDTHIAMVKRHTNKYGKANYNIFVQEFNKCKWETESFKGSLFDKSTDSEIHASIIKFNGIGMIMQDFVEYLKMRYCLYRYLKNTKIDKEIKNTHIWKDEV